MLLLGIVSSWTAVNARAATATQRRAAAPIVITEDEPAIVSEEDVAGPNDTEFLVDAEKQPSATPERAASDVADLESQVEQQMSELDEQTSNAAGVTLHGTAVPSFADAQEEDDGRAKAPASGGLREMDVTELARYDHEVEKNRALIGKTTVARAELESRLEETMHLLTPLRKVLQELSEREHQLSHRLQQMKLQAKLDKIAHERQVLAMEEKKHADKLEEISRMKSQQAQQVAALKNHLESVDAELQAVDAEDHDDASIGNAEASESSIPSQEAAAVDDDAVQSALGDSREDQAALEQARQLESEETESAASTNAEEDADTDGAHEMSEKGSDGEGKDEDEDEDEGDVVEPDEVPEHPEGDKETSGDASEDPVATEAQVDSTNDAAVEVAETDDAALDKLAQRTEKRREELSKVATEEETPATYNADMGSSSQPLED